MLLMPNYSHEIVYVFIMIVVEHSNVSKPGCRFTKTRKTVYITHLFKTCNEMKNPI